MHGLNAPKKAGGDMSTSYSGYTRILRLIRCHHGRYASKIVVVSLVKIDVF